MFAHCEANTRAARERQPELAAWLTSPEHVQVAHRKVKAKAETVLAEYTRLFDASGLSQCEEEAGDAYEAVSKAKKALFAHQPQTMADVRAVARILWQAAERSGHWYEIPARDFLQALCPDLVTV